MKRVDKTTMSVKRRIKSNYRKSTLNRSLLCCVIWMDGNYYMTTLNEVVWHKTNYSSLEF